VGRITNAVTDAEFDGLVCGAEQHASLGDHRSFDESGTVCPSFAPAAARDRQVVHLEERSAGDPVEQAEIAGGSVGGVPAVAVAADMGALVCPHDPEREGVGLFEQIAERDCGRRVRAEALAEGSSAARATSSSIESARGATRSSSR